MTSEAARTTTRPAGHATPAGGTTVAVRVDGVGWEHPDAVAMRDAMTREMQIRYADRVNVPGHLPPGMNVDADTVAYTAVAYVDGRPVGHLALRRLDGDLELKRMYVAPAQRGAGVSTALLTAAEIAAREHGAPRIILQTGDRQPDAVRLYVKAGYTPIPIYPPYQSIAYSHCFEKVLIDNDPR
jgi:GNAT superfamily N-acetyltransferase